LVIFLSALWRICWPF